jgi:ATPase family protein associated with various cellular activities (AAA)
MTVSLLSYALAALVPRSRLPAESAEMGYLESQLAAVDPLGQGWATTLDEYLAHPAARDEALLRIARELDLHVGEALTVALAAAVESDAIVGRILAHLQAPVGGSRPSLGLLATAFAELSSMDTLAAGTAIRAGLLKFTNDQAPLPERAVMVPLPLAYALDGTDGMWPGATIGLVDFREIPLASSTVSATRQHANALRDSDRVLVIRTGSAPEGRSVAALLARFIDRRAVFLDTDQLSGLGPWLSLRKLLPVFWFDLAPGERRAIPAIAAYDGPVVALCGPDGTPELASGDAALTWSLPVPPRDDRARLWHQAIGDWGIADALARDHRHTSGRIAHLAQVAGHHAQLSGRSRPTADDVVAASRGGGGTGLDALAQSLPESIPDAALVTTPTLRADLEALVLRCRARDTLVRSLGASAVARYTPGVRALFVGPSGTGKTLAAGWLATRLGLALFRVDLASITSKYIGETEKNLAQLLARAEQAEVVLLFDEADSLFGKRTDVKDSNDRFANAQTNYLLQRIESFDGITLLTSNSRGRFDSAFSRRLDAVIEFPIPGPEERRLLWQSHLGEGHRLSQSELNRLAATADLVGGHIRNVVLTASMLAQSGERSITYPDLAYGLAAEYRKLGRQLPAELQLPA